MYCGAQLKHSTLESKEVGDTEKNKQREGVELRERSEGSELGAAYNYYFLCIKSFRCAHAVVAASFTRHLPESCIIARKLPLSLNHHLPLVGTIIH